ncbi:protein kinase domain-containing protein [Exiguobacterium sp. CinTr1]|uniref:protein kinase domain-containing protein n=1 Tax=Exiguobacterium sp. CinTr1 TaxID=2995315 RepID=UPI0022E4E8B8|nr:protein kinase [Exiguobacterium sp. CinTr1]
MSIDHLESPALTDINNLFLNRQKNSLFSHITDVSSYYSFYSDSLPINSVQFAHYLSKIHIIINMNLDFMATRIDNGKHFNAVPSRELLGIIEEIKRINKILEYSYPILCFKLDPEYEEFLKRCLTFLKKSGGSTIPDEIEEIPFIEYKSIFVFNTSVSVRPSSTNVPASQIGEGSYAIVYKYVHPELHIPIALKRAKNDLSQDELERFRREYAILAELNSPFIIKPYTFDNEKNEYTMEYIDKTLDRFLNETNDTLTINFRKNILVQFFRAIGYVHSKQKLHRDLSPNNVLIQIFDDQYILKLADFGLVKDFSSSMTNHQTSIKGSWNDISDLERVGFDNYNVKHEIYSITKMTVFILTGKTNLSSLSVTRHKKIREFVNIGTNPNLDSRFKNVDEIHRYVFDNDLFSEVRN